MNNTFEVVYSEYNSSTNQYTNITYQLSCIGYYLVGLQTTPVPYWNNTANYQQAWLDNYNQYILNLWQEKANSRMEDDDVDVVDNLVDIEVEDVGC